MTKAVYGIVRTHAGAASLIDKLRSGGFASTEVSVLAPHNSQDQGLAVEKHTKSLEGTATGATAGGVLGGVVGLLAGIGTLAIPGLGILSLQALSWQRSAVWGSVRASAALPGDSSASEFRNMKRSAMKATLKKAAS